MENTAEIYKLLKIRKTLGKCEQKTYIDERLKVLLKEYYRLHHGELRRVDGVLVVIDKDDPVILHD